MDRLAINGGTPCRQRPFPQRAPYGEEEIELLEQAVRSQNLFGMGGTMVPRLEQAFCELYGVRHAAASSSGTAALHVAIGTINPSPGDEIITAPITDAGTILPIVYQNCIPVFADVDETYTLDPADVERKITARTAAIVAVHLFGNACNMEALVEVARRHGIPLVEDCSQAHATRYQGRYLGAWGDIATFSFQQSKHMTTGDGGMTITNRDEWADRMSMFRDKGWTRQAGLARRSYLFLAPNYRMTELQGAVGLAQIRKVRTVVEQRTALGTRLNERINGIEGLHPVPVE